MAPPLPTVAPENPALEAWAQAEGAGGFDGGGVRSGHGGGVANLETLAAIELMTIRDWAEDFASFLSYDVESWGEEWQHRTSPIPVVFRWFCHDPPEPWGRTFLAELENVLGTGYVTTEWARGKELISAEEDRAEVMVILARLARDGQEGLGYEIHFRDSVLVLPSWSAIPKEFAGAEASEKP